MPKEIERKFLLVSDEYRRLAEPVFYRQGYLCTDPERVVRVRVAGEQAFLAVKSKNEGIARTEYEYEIPLADANEMLSKLALPHIIEKQRYRVFFEGKCWEIDEFRGENEGLAIAEIELNTPDEIFAKPAWTGEEVSHDERYYNSNISQKPYKQWN